MVRVIIIGTGGWGAVWCRHTLVKGEKEGWIKVVGAVDTDPSQLIYAREGLGLSEEVLYTDPKEAMEQLKPDACIISAAPYAHAELILLALEHRIPILCEKPVTDNLDSMVTILQKVKKNPIPFGITFSHRFSRPIVSLKREILSGRYGQLDYLVMNFTCKEERPFTKRKQTAWEVMTNEFNIHHLDYLLYLAGASCEWIFAEKWNPHERTSLHGGGQGMIIMKCKNGVRISLESNIVAANSLFGWGNPFIRAEMERAELLLKGDQLFCYWKEKDAPINHSCESEKIPMVPDERYWGNEYLLKQFVDWMKGKEAMETSLEQAAWSQMLVFAAVESAKSGKKIYLDSFIREAMENQK